MVGADLAYGGQTSCMSGLALSLTVCGRGRSGLRGADLIHVKSYDLPKFVWGFEVFLVYIVV